MGSGACVQRRRIEHRLQQRRGSAGLNLLAELSNRPALVFGEQSAQVRGHSDVATPDESQKEGEAEKLVGSLSSVRPGTGIGPAPLLMQPEAATLKRAEEMSIGTPIPV